MEAQINNYRFTSTIATQTINHGMTSKHSFMIWWSFWFLGINLLRFTAQCSLEKFSASFCTWVVETLVVLFIAPFSQLEHVLLCIVVLYYYTVSYRVSKQPAARDRAAVCRRAATRRQPGRYNDAILSHAIFSDEKSFYGATFSPNCFWQQQPVEATQIAPPSSHSGSQKRLVMLQLLASGIVLCIDVVYSIHSSRVSECEW